MTNEPTHHAGGPGEPTAYDRRMLALMNRKEADVLHATVKRRRAAVVLHIVLTIALLGAFASGELWANVTMLALLVPWCLATGAINSATRGLLELRRRVLDERQRTQKDAAVARAHHLCTWMLGVCVVGFGLARVADADVTVPLFEVLLVVAGVHWMLPLWIAGLAAEDEPSEDLATT